MTKILLINSANIDCMTSSVSDAMTVKVSELQRLKTLLPSQLHNRVILQGTTEINPTLIKCERVVGSKGKVQIQIDLIRWEQLAIDQRNLLFWHEVARIQKNTIHKDSWEMASLAMGLSAALVEVFSQNILLLSLALTVSGIAVHRLYQRNRGERSLREATEADQDAIALAICFGYTLPKAYKSLSKALKTLSVQTSKKWLQAKYKARLQVLKVNATRGVIGNE